jgi:hypothetical protein
MEVSTTTYNVLESSTLLQKQMMQKSGLTAERVD